MTIEAYPLTWPPGWKRTVSRKDAAFREGGSRGRRLELTDGVRRVFDELSRLNIREENVVISSNVRPTLGGRGGAITVQDAGVAVYWTDKQKRQRCIAVDRYTRVPDNLAAIAATLEAMRAIERHGGAEILDRAFTGFTALPAPEQPFEVLGVGAHASREEIERAYRLLASKHHPDKGGDPDMMARINAAREAML
jgi:hypothetical protein